MREAGHGDEDSRFKIQDSRRGSGDEDSRFKIQDSRKGRRGLGFEIQGPGVRK